MRSRKRQLAAGPVAQWLEPAAHNGLVAGSSPAGPTNEISDLSILIFSTPPEIPTGSGTISAQIAKSSQWHLRQAGRARRCACRFAFGIPSPFKWPKPCPSPDRSQCRLFPQQRTFGNVTVMPALCQWRTFLRGCRANTITLGRQVRVGAHHGSSPVFMEFLYFGCLIHIVFICDLPALLGLERAAS